METPDGIVISTDGRCVAASGLPVEAERSSATVAEGATISRANRPERLAPAASDENDADASVSR
jgi:hypothetical protein